MTDESPILELAHTTPGRIRFRWRGGAEPPAALLERLRAIPDIQAVEFRRPSRSLVVLHQNGFGVEEVRALGRELDVEVREPEAPAAAASPAGPGPDPLASTSPDSSTLPGVPQSPWEQYTADFEAILLVGLLINWVRDLVVARTLRPGTIILILLTLMNLWQYWQKRWAGEKEPEEQYPELETLTV